MRVKSLSIALALTVVLSSSTFAAPQKRVDPRERDLNPVEWVIRTARKIVRSLGQPVIPIPSTPTTTTT